MLVPTNSNEITSININIKERMKDFNIEGEKIYNENLQSIELDNINLIYVTLTRAEKELYILSQKAKQPKKEKTSSKIENILTAFLKENYSWNVEENLFTLGSLKKVNKKEFDTEYYNLNKINDLKTINYDLKDKSNKEDNSAKEEGIKIHKILSFINTKDDIENALERGLKLDILKEDEILEVKNKISEIVNNPKLDIYFNNILKSYNEKEIITNSNQSIIPDRIVFHTKNTVRIIDYKTGKSDQTYSANN